MIPTLALLLTACCAATTMALEGCVAPPYKCTEGSPFRFPSKSDPGGPLAPAASSISFTGYHCAPNLKNEGVDACAINSDTWYPALGADDVLWSSWTDGSNLGISSNSGGAAATTGWAVLEGASAASGPKGMRIARQGTVAHSAAPLGGRYPCASFSINGTWLYGTYALDNGPRTTAAGKSRTCGDNGWCVGGPFIGFHLSVDQGRSWDYGPNVSHLDAGETNIFGQWPWPRAGEQPFQFKVMQPHFVDHGRNNVHSPDGYAYLVTHGCDPELNRAEAYCGWTQGSQIYLLRARTLTPSTANSRGSYEFWAGASGWVVGDYRAAVPIVDWEDHVGVTNVVWVASAQKYLMFSTFPTENGWSNGTMDSWVAEAEALPGPWHLVEYWERFGQQGYFLNAPSSLWARNKGWLWYSSLWLRAPGIVPDPPFCNITSKQPSKPYSGKGNCYGSVIGQIVYTQGVAA